MKIDGLFKAATNDTNGQGRTARNAALLGQQKFVSFVAAFAFFRRVIFGMVLATRMMNVMRR
jgi:hypothetical protein